MLGFVHLALLGRNALGLCIYRRAFASSVLEELAPAGSSGGGAQYRDGSTDMSHIKFSYDGGAETLFCTLVSPSLPYF